MLLFGGEFTKRKVRVQRLAFHVGFIYKLLRLDGTGLLKLNGLQTNEIGERGAVLGGDAGL